MQNNATKNPVLLRRTAHNLTKTQFAIICGCDYSWISQVENGAARTLKGKILEGLVSLGYDREEIVQEYEQWRESLADEIKRNMAAV